MAYTTTAFSVSGTGQSAVVAAQGAGLQIVVIGFGIELGGTTPTSKWQDADVDLTAAMALHAAGSSTVVHGSSESPVFRPLVANQALNVTLAGTTPTAAGWVTWELASDRGSPNTVRKVAEGTRAQSANA